jgi:hypothetical protein
MTRCAVAAAAVLLLAGCSDSGAAASCAGPQTTVTPTTFAAGGEVRVAGEFFLDDCYDTGQTGTPPATQDIEIRLIPSGKGAETFVLTTVDADEDGRIDTSVRVPDDVPPGPARIEAGFGAPAAVEVTGP